MISLDRDTLQEIKNELDTYRNLTRVQLFDKCINDRLRATLLRYNEKIDYTSEYLLKQSSVRVLKALTKIKKVSDKDIIQQYMESDDD